MLEPPLTDQILATLRDRTLCQTHFESGQMLGDANIQGTAAFPLSQPLARCHRQKLCVPSALFRRHPSLPREILILQALILNYP